MVAIVTPPALLAAPQAPQSGQANAPAPQNGQAAVTQSGQATALSGQDVIAYLNQTVTWYRHLYVEQQIANEPNDIPFLDDDRELADQIVRLSFDFAKAEAGLLAKVPTGTAPQSQAQDASSAYRALFDLAVRSENQVKQSQDEIESLRQKLVTATGRRRQQLQSAIAETQSELDLARTRRDVMRSMVEFVSGSSVSGVGAGGLLSQIEDLEKTVPALAAQPSGAGRGAAAPGRSASAAVAPRKPEPSGILALISDLIGLTRKINTLDQTIRLTDALAQSSKTLRSPLGAALRELTQRGDQLASQPESNDPAVLAQQKRELDALTAQFKGRSAAVLPLVKQRILFDLYRRNLTNWRSTVKSQHTAELKSLIVRLTLLGIVLGIVISSSELWRRAIFKYVQDPRRRYQFLLFRRIALWFVVAVVIAFAFATELGSLATFAGLLTAGVAVALQNVILSVAGYFFLIGKYGVRVGDRVQISGVTGEVVDIGLVRLHLMELASSGGDARPTGRVVVFSNSVVFQPSSGLFKQIPGTSFGWHEITLTLAPESDYRAVEERLVGAVEKVFAEHREEMESQRRRMEKTLSPVSVHALGPQSRLRLTQSGLEVVIRYPLELENAASIDDRITRELLDAIDRKPKLKLVGTGTPNIQPLTERTEVAK